MEREKKENNDQSSRCAARACKTIPSEALAPGSRDSDDSTMARSLVLDRINRNLFATVCAARRTVSRVPVAIVAGVLTNWPCSSKRCQSLSAPPPSYSRLVIFALTTAVRERGREIRGRHVRSAAFNCARSGPWASFEIENIGFYR